MTGMRVELGNTILNALLKHVETTSTGQRTIKLHTGEPGLAWINNLSTATTRGASLELDTDNAEIVSALLTWDGWDGDAETITHWSLWKGADRVWSGALDHEVSCEPGQLVQMQFHLSATGDVDPGRIATILAGAMLTNGWAMFNHVYLQVHTGNPGVTRKDNISLLCPDRAEVVTSGAVTGASVATDATSFTVADTGTPETLTHVTLWLRSVAEDDETAVMMRPLDSQLEDVSPGDSVTITGLFAVQPVDEGEVETPPFP